MGGNRIDINSHHYVCFNPNNENVFLKQFQQNSNCACNINGGKMVSRLYIKCMRRWSVQIKIITDSMRDSIICTYIFKSDRFSFQLKTKMRGECQHSRRAGLQCIWSWSGRFSGSWGNPKHAWTTSKYSTMHNLSQKIIEFQPVSQPQPHSSWHGQLQQIIPNTLKTF